MPVIRRAGFVVTAAGLALAVLTGCETTNPTFRMDNVAQADKDSTFSAGTSGKGIVVASFSIAKGYNNRKNYCITQDSAFDLYFTQYNQGTKTTKVGANHYVYSRKHFAPFGHSEKLYSPQHKIFMVRPGSYVLKQINWRFGPGFFQTPLVADRKGGGRSEKYTAGYYPDGGPIGNAPRFTVRPGEIVYVGNWVICADTTKGRITVTQHPRLARAALAEYTNIKGRMVYRPLRTR